MAELTRDSGRMTIGLDLGDRYSRLCVLDDSGEILEEGRVRTTERGLSQRFGNLPSSRIALEVGTHSPWVHRLLSALGHEVLVANPRKLRLIYRNESKNDRLDAEHLARLARVDPRLLHPIQHRDRESQEAMAVLRSRQAVVGVRTRLVTHVRGAMKSAGSRLRSCSTQSFHKQAEGQIPPEMRPALDPLLELIAELSGKIAEYDRQIERLAAERYPETVVLRQISGVGVLTSLWFVLAVGDPRRFRSSRHVGAYLGLKPRRSQSGTGDPELRITKVGDKRLRALLVSAAQYILGPFGPDTDLRRWGLALAGRGRKNAKKRAVVAVARKLAVLLHMLWITGQVYQPLRHGQAAA